MTGGFWNFNIGHVLTIAAIVIGLVTEHDANVQKIEALSVKVDLMYTHFQSEINRTEYNR